jgi:peptide/nickel transport system permease protein
MRKRLTHFLGTLFVLLLFGAGAVTITFLIVGLTDELAEDRFLPGGETLPPTVAFTSRYPRWVSTVVGSGFSDFGQSNKVVVKNVLADRLPVTATVGLISWALAWGLAFVFALCLATRWRSLAPLYRDRVYPMVQAVPTLLVVIVFYLLLLYVEPDSSRLLRTGVGIASLVALLAPAATALWFNAIERVLRTEYVRVARARGVSPWALWRRHVLPNALVSSGLLTQSAFSLAAMVVGSAFVEGVFRLGGVAEAFIEGTRHGQAELCALATLLYFVTTAAGVLLSELVVIVLDPGGEVSREAQPR